MTVRGLRNLLILLFSAVLALFIAAPFACEPGEVTGLNGVPLLPDYFDRWAEMNPLSAAAYGLGDILCHQEDGRSFTMNGSQMPVCVRDVSALAGLIVGLAISVLLPKALSWRSCIIFLAAAFAVMSADVAVQWFMGMNVFITRIITGSACGLAVAFVLDRWLWSIWDSTDVPDV